jgi:hypothetical protein
LTPIAPALASAPAAPFAVTDRDQPTRSAAPATRRFALRVGHLVLVASFSPDDTGDCDLTADEARECLIETLCTMPLTETPTGPGDGPIGT